MIRHSTKTLSILSLMLAFLLLLGPLANSLLAATAVVKDGVVNIRQAPNVKSRKIGVLLKGARVTVAEPKGEWTRVQLRSGLSGWVSTALLKIDGKTPVTVTPSTAAARPVASVAKPETAAAKKMIITRDTALIRKGPGTNFSQLGKAIKGQAFVLLGTKGDWNKVETRNGPAYIAAFLGKIVAASSTPVVSRGEEPPFPAGVDLTAGTDTANEGTSTPWVDPSQFGPPQTSYIPPETPVTVPSAPAQTPAAPAAVTPATPVVPGNYGSILIVIDAGHGGSDPGARGANGSWEKNVNLALAQKLAARLLAEGFQVRLTRSDDTFVPLYDRSGIANNANASLFISLHANASPRHDRTGTSVWYTVKEGYPATMAQAAHRKSLAETVLRNLVANLGLPSEGIHLANYVVTRETRMPSILIESGYIDNPNEERLLNDSALQERDAEGIVRGVKEYLAANPAGIGPSNPASEFDTVINAAPAPAAETDTNASENPTTETFNFWQQNSSN